MMIFNFRVISNLVNFILISIVVLNVCQCQRRIQDPKDSGDLLSGPNICIKLLDLGITQQKVKFTESFNETEKWWCRK